MEIGQYLGSVALMHGRGSDQSCPNVLPTPLTSDICRCWTAFGVRGSMVDGLSFGTNHNAGVCIHFAEKEPSPLRRSGHSALTVTVADLEGLTNALGAEHGEASSASPP